MSLLYALPAYDRSFSFAPSDIAIASFLLFSYLRPLSSLTEAKFVTAITIFGSLTAAFEFLIGAIPAGAVVILGMLALDPSPDRALLQRRACLGLFCFLSAIALCFAVKAIAVAAVWKIEEISNVGAELGLQLLHAHWNISAENAASLKAIGIDPDTIRSSRFLSSVYALAKIVYFSSVIGLGSKSLGALVVIIIPAVLLARSCKVFWQTSDNAERWREILAVSATAILPLWYLVFTSHTIVHAFFMVRPMVWPFAILVAREVWRSISGHSCVDR